MYTTLTFCLRIVMGHLVVLFLRLGSLVLYPFKSRWYISDHSTKSSTNTLLLHITNISNLLHNHLNISVEGGPGGVLKVWSIISEQELKQCSPFLELQYYKSQCQIEHCQILHTVYWTWLLTFPVFSPWVTLVRLCWKAFVTYINYTVTSTNCNKIYMEAS